MAGTKEDAKLEIKEIIAKIRRGESPSTSRAYEFNGSVSTWRPSSGNGKSHGRSCSKKPSQCSRK